jgi:DivIVA domain-containing protein
VLKGYDRRKVDAFLVRCAKTLSGHGVDLPELAGYRRPGQPGEPVTPTVVREVRFPVVLRGYDLAEVDALLRTIAAALPAGLEPARPAWQGPPVPPVLGPGPAVSSNLRGYLRSEVDAFLVRCAHSLGDRVGEVPELAALTGRPRTGEPLTAGDVEQATFHLAWRGYRVDAVDALLDRVQAALRR